MFRTRQLFLRRKSLDEKPRKFSNSITKVKQEQLVGHYAKVKGNIKTFYDAAFYLINNLFIDDSYNQTQNDYNYLVRKP
jgi:hypothetical protein